MPGEGQEGGGNHSSGGTSVASTAMVRHPTEHAGGVAGFIAPQPSLLLSPKGEPHPLLGQGGLTLAAWRVSGDAIDSQAFLRQQPLFSQVPGVMARVRLMRDPGVNGLAGVTRNRLIHFRPLWMPKWIFWPRCLRRVGSIPP